jgi:hypothetical protein
MGSDSPGRCIVGRAGSSVFLLRQEFITRTENWILIFKCVNVKFVNFTVIHLFIPVYYHVCRHFYGTVPDWDDSHSPE